MCNTIYSYINMEKDQEIPSGKNFDELWTDDGEPVPAEKPLWMGGPTHKVKIKPAERP